MKSVSKYIGDENMHLHHGQVSLFYALQNIENTPTGFLMFSPEGLARHGSMEYNGESESGLL